MSEQKDLCRFIEVAHGLKQRNVFISLDDLTKWQKEQPDIELYSSYFRYYDRDPEVGPVLAGFIMDFDDRDNPERARKDAIIAIKVLMDSYGLQENDISIAFSGKKGFHVAVNRRALGIEPHTLLPKIFKQMAKELIAQNGLKTLDLAIYDRRRLIRLVNSRHPETQLYKIPLTFTELQTLTVDKIKAMATQRRPHLTHETDHLLSEKAHDWLTRNIETYMKSFEDKHTEYANEDFQNIDILPCVKGRLEKGSERGLRNRHCWQLATYFDKKGLPLEECLRIMKPWHGRLEQASDDPYTWQDCEATVKYVYETKKYSIGCTSEYTEGVCVSKDKCPLFKPKPQEEYSKDEVDKAETILQGDPLTYVTFAVNLIHVGDENLIKIAYISGLSAKLAHAIHLWPIGTSQKGKSHILHKVIFTFPKDHYEIFTSASPKSLFYYAKQYGEDAFNGKLIYIDEVESSKLTLPLLRTLTGQTDIEPRHLSVYDSELLDLRIKGPRVIWFTSIKPFGAEQLRNRFFFTNPDETKTQDDNVHRLQIEDKENQDPNNLQQFKIAKAMTEKILQETKDLEVNIPYLERITWPYKDKRWLFPIFKNFIKTLAKIHYRNRQIKDKQIIAEEDDFNFVKYLWEPYITHVIYRVSAPAESILNILGQTQADGLTKAMISEQTGYSTKHVGRLLEELGESELINSEKMEHTRSRVYWKATLPKIDEIKIEMDKKEVDIQSRIYGSNQNENELAPSAVPNVHFGGLGDLKPL